MQNSMAEAFVQHHAYADIDFAVLTAPAPAKHDTSSCDHVLLKLLRELRDRLARQHNKKPYQVLPEQKLEEMALTHPTTLEALVQQVGVSVAKAQKFGASFTQLIQQYMLDHDIDATSSVPTLSPKRYQHRLALIRYIDMRLDFDDIAARMDTTREELIEELEHIHQSGVRLKLDYYVNQLLDNTAQRELFNYFKRAGEDNIEQALDELGQHYTEEEIRLMRLAFRYTANP